MPRRPASGRHDTVVGYTHAISKNPLAVDRRRIRSPIALKSFSSLPPRKPAMTGEKDLGTIGHIFWS